MLRTPSRLHLVCLCLLFSLTGVAQEPRVNLFISCNLDCAWNIDGDQRGILKKGEEARVEVLLGLHKLEAYSSAGKLYESTLEVVEPAEERISIDLTADPATALKEFINKPSKPSLPPTQSVPEVPTFQAESRQVLVGASVWMRGKENPSPDIRSPKDLRNLSQDALIDLIGRYPAAALGLTSKDFRVLDNSVEQKINYFKKDDFAGQNLIQRWHFHPGVRGTWGFFSLNSFLIPGSFYLIGYVPPSLQPGECHAIQVTVEGRDVGLYRDHFCKGDALVPVDPTTADGADVGKAMRDFANSTAAGNFKVWLNAFAFWSRGTLSFGSKSQEIPHEPTSDFKYVITVRDKKSPATVRVASEFYLADKFLDAKAWDCAGKHPLSIHVLGFVYKSSGELAQEFADSMICGANLTEPEKKVISGAFKNAPVGWDKKLLQEGLAKRFDTEIELPVGDYNIRVVVSDGRKNFGKASMPLRVQAFDADKLALSDLVLSSTFGDPSDILRLASYVLPGPLIPKPLVSKGLEYIPAADPEVKKHRKAILYFEIYESLLANQAPSVGFTIRVTDLKTDEVVVSTPLADASLWIIAGNPVIPIALELATDKLKKGSYKLEVQASDSAEQETDWKEATLKVE